MERARRAAALALFLLLVACARAHTTGGELRWTEGEDIDSLSPLLTTEIAVTDLSVFTQGYLFLFDRHGDLVPSLCVRIPTQANHLISADGTSVTYALRHGVLWQDGAPFTSADVAFSVKTILDPHVNDSDTIAFDDIASVQTPSAYTVVVHLKQPSAPFVSRFLTPGIGSGIIPKHLLAGKDFNHASYNSLPVGLGPFRYVKWRRGSDVEMEAFDRWWGGRPKLRRVIYRIIPDASTALNELATGELDAFGRLPNEQYLQATSIGRTRTIDFPTTAYEHIDFNMQSPILRDRRIREALAHAIDRQTILEKVEHGSGFLACTPIPHTSWAYDAHTPCMAFDLGAARRLLDRAGWRMGAQGIRWKDGAPLRLTLVSTVGNISRDETAILVQSWFRRIGVALSYRRYQANQLFAHEGGILSSGRFDLALYAWFWSADPDIGDLYACAQAAPRGENESRYCNQRVDELLRDATTHYDRARRAADYVQVQQVLARDLPSIVLFQREDHLTIARGFRGTAPTPIVLFSTPAGISN